MEKYLEHHGILGQKWGVRRYQNEDGTLTEAGKKRLEYRVGDKRLKNRQKVYSKYSKKSQYALSEYKRDVATNLHLKSEHTKRAQNNDTEVYEIGKRTIGQRSVATLSSALINSGAAAYALMAETAIPLAAIPIATLTAGYVWYKSYR